MGKPATFNVQFNGAQGHLDARVVAPSGAEDEAALMEVEKGHYAVRFVPKENGTHQVHTCNRLMNEACRLQRCFFFEMLLESQF